jgi:hypothetical protein
MGAWSVLLPAKSKANCSIQPLHHAEFHVGHIKRLFFRGPETSTHFSVPLDNILKKKGSSN